MGDSFKTLPSRPLSQGALLYRHQDLETPAVGVADPAERVMTDLSRVPAVTATIHELVDTALQKMIHARVRLLLIVDDAWRLLGVVTARDLMGERPVQIAREERVTRDTITVGQVMTPLERIDVLTLEQVQEARVGDIIQTLRSTGRQHILVVECDEVSCERVRGIFSATQIGRYLGTEVTPEGPTQSFAELAKLLQRGSGAATGQADLSRS